MDWKNGVKDEVIRFWALPISTYFSEHALPIRQLLRQVHVVGWSI